MTHQLGPPNKISDDALLLFKQVIEDDLRKFAQEIVYENPSMRINDLIGLIPQVLDTPIIDKINSKYRDTSLMKYKKELNKFSLMDLKEIARSNDLKISGTRNELMARISEKIELRDYTVADLNSAKSFMSSTTMGEIKPKKKKSKEKSVSISAANYISDSD
jgi:hypothetical protein